jgi:hypothetical protein
MSEKIALPICASCTFGLCVQQIMPIEGATLIAPQRDREPWEDPDEETDGTTAVPHILTYSALCFWNPHPSDELCHPNEMMYVKYCSRYKKRND